jgi:molecular chaperone GrpE
MSKKHHHNRPPAADPAAETVVEAPHPLQADGGAVADPLDTAVELPSAERRAPSPAVDEDNDKYLRLAAEYENYRKRTTKERMEMTARAQGDLLKALIDPLDDLARVIEQGKAASDPKTVLDAIEVVDKKMMKSLAAAGLEVLNPVGAPFDPQLHEAVSTVAAATPEEDHLVAAVFQPGYRFNGQLLRAARVVVKQWNG